MATSCETVQELLAEVGGEAERLSGEERRHLEHCPQCAEIAAAEHALGLIFANVLPPPDPAIEEGVRRAMRTARRRRRIVALLPVAASLLVALLGTVMLGGLPGGSMLALLPVWSSQGWMSLAVTVNDWSAVFSTAADAASGLLGPGMLASAVAISLFGVVAVTVAARRWRRVSPWRSGS